MIAAVGLALFALPSVGGSYWRTFFAPMAIVGLGMALTVTPLTATVMGAVERRAEAAWHRRSTTPSRAIAALLAVAVIGVVSMPLFAHALAHRLEPLAARTLAPAHAHRGAAHRFADMTLPAYGAGQPSAPGSRAVSARRSSRASAGWR